MGASHDRERDSAVAGACAKGSVTGALVTLALVGAGIGGVWAGLRYLERIPNSPETYRSQTQGLTAALILSGAALVTTTGLVLSRRLAFAPVRRGAKFTTGALIAAFFLWFAPTPFGVHRLLLVAGLLSGAALFGIAALRAAYRQWLPRDGVSCGLKDGMAGAAGMTAGGAFTILLIKIDALGWANAID